MSRADTLRKAKKQERRKAVHERRLMYQLRGIFKKQNQEFYKLFSELGIVFDARGTEKALTDTLEKHYKKVTHEFRDDVVADINDVLKEHDIENIDEGRKEIAAALALMIRREISGSVQQITETSNRNIRQAVADHADDAKAAYRDLQGKTLARSKTIASVETQKAAEGAKQFVAEVSIPIVSSLTAGTNLLRAFKVWQILDASARPGHAAANGQRVLVADPFMVDGELLMYPGDWSLGASAGNVINCRCSAIQEFSIL